MEYTLRYTTQSGKPYQIKMRYNERIRDRDGFDQFLLSADVEGPGQCLVTLPSKTARFSTYEDFTSFGAYASINYLGVREAAIEGLRTKILTRIQDHLEGLG
ncbi:MAG: hypothetical protein P4L33_12545 [Capsulimonadaceae bacterium]|nr:hypothetical protein [Capsulimonadaceae bacterium]